MPKLSHHIKKMLKDNDKILLSLSFNPSNYTPVIPITSTVGLDSLPVAAYRYIQPNLIHEFPCSTYDFLYNMYQLGNIPNLNSITERYILSSYNNLKDKMLGQIEWIGNYITSYTNTNGVLTNVLLQEFMVTSAIGVYKNVYKVIIDFTMPTSYIVYLIIKSE
jgi:hypothetical protein